MPGVARIVVPEEPHHVIQRRNRRLPTFFCEDDYCRYLGLLRERCKEYSVEVWAYCLMTNHEGQVTVPIIPALLKRQCDSQEGQSENLIIQDLTPDPFMAVYRGSDEMKDLTTTGLPQAFGVNPGQYAKLGEQIQSIKVLADALHAKTITATGHSLGGGMAIAVASTGYVDGAVVFNPAGVHEDTYTAIGGDASKVQTKVKSYSSRGDVLTNIQDMLSFMLPSAVGERYIVEGAGAHGIEAMLSVFNTSDQP